MPPGPFSWTRDGGQGGRGRAETCKAGGDAGSVSECQPLPKARRYQVLNKQDVEYLELLPPNNQNPLRFIQFFQPWVFEGLEEYPTEILCFLRHLFLPFSVSVATSWLRSYTPPAAFTIRRGWEPGAARGGPLGRRGLSLWRWTFPGPQRCSACARVCAARSPSSPGLSRQSAGAARSQRARCT